MAFGDLFKNIRQRRVDNNQPLLFPGFGNIPDATPGSPGARPDELANEIRQREDQRQQDVLAGRSAIDDAFARFDDSYFNQYANDVTGYYYPQIDQQYNRAQGRTRASLADRGVSQSSIAGNAFGDLLRQRVAARTDAAGRAVDQANALRSNVENTKSDLYSLNQTAADPAAANARATAEATALVAPPSVSPLGEVFAATVQPIVRGIQSYQNRAPNYQSPFPSGNSVRVVP